MQITDVDRGRFFWSRELYNEGQHFDINITIKRNLPIELKQAVQLQWPCGRGWRRLA